MVAFGNVLSTPEGAVIDPVEEIVVVEFPPKYAVPKLENTVDEAPLLNIWRADHVLLWERLISPFIVPDVVTGPPVNVRVDPVEPLLTDVTLAADVLHVPEPVIAPVPFPVRHPVSVVAPVPPFATVRALVRFKVPIQPVVAVKSVEVALPKDCKPAHVLLVVVPKATAIVPVVVKGPPVTGYVVLT